MKDDKIIRNTSQRLRIWQKFNRFKQILNSFIVKEQ